MVLLSVARLVASKSDANEHPQFCEWGGGQCSEVQHRRRRCVHATVDVRHAFHGETEPSAAKQLIDAILIVEREKKVARTAVRRVAGLGPASAGQRSVLEG
jgi:hypothetical protein